MSRCDSSADYASHLFRGRLRLLIVSVRLEYCDKARLVPGMERGGCVVFKLHILAANSKSNFRVPFWAPLGRNLVADKQNEILIDLLRPLGHGVKFSGEFRETLDRHRQDSNLRGLRQPIS